MANYRIRNINQLKEILIPIFDKHLLLTSKYYSFYKFKKCLNILDYTLLTNEEKNHLIENILIITKDINYISPFWLETKKDLINKSFEEITQIITNINDIKSIIPKPWVIGFIEAEGSFFITKKDENRLVHCFGISQKLDPIVLLSLKYLFHIPTKVKYKYKHNYYLLETSNSRSIENIIKYFLGPHNTHTNMKGSKGLEFRIWARTYFKHKGNYEKLLKTKELINRIRNKNKIEGIVRT
uniref:Putative LAGLIDADG homing endonuclease n=1 Tax=Helicosporidium sp. subsp. Simulium jonesii TaxID=145475 RepID=D3IZX1_HELSJ|nr:putative LAGLIDADG homing endonuclease [Helicosporidium sp. ex Simulium jonesi]ACT36198.1 putative LAGLIDADG homing endonuclease [Helicosporidium sp. ex Simulium jonesi]